MRLLSIPGGAFAFSIRFVPNAFEQISPATQRNDRDITPEREVLTVVQRPLHCGRYRLGQSATSKMPCSPAPLP